jgi:pimeloyl-ACP methyl ester carboxylesterase
VHLAFDDFELDPARFELRRNGVRVPLEPQVFNLLALLVAHHDRVVTKEELIDTVWQGRLVGETAVTSRMKQARQALGDDGKAQRLIRTVHGRGYRFVGPVRKTTEHDDDHAPIAYAVSDRLHIAYQITGSGPRDIVLVPGFVSHLELDWADPRHAHFLDRLATMGRLIRFDKRGTGLSDRPDHVPDLETRIHDVLAVMDAAGSRRAVLFGYSEGGPMASLFAATHPDRVAALILYGTYARRLHADDYPWAPAAEDREQYAHRLADEWSWEADLRVMCPSADDTMARWWGSRTRAAATPSTIRALIAMNTKVDVRGTLSSIRVPTLVLHRRGDRDSRVEEGRFLADRIPGANFVELPGADHFVAVDPDQILDPVEPFVAQDFPSVRPELALAAILTIGNSADPDDVARQFTNGRLARGTDGRPLLVYDGPGGAIRDVTAYLGARAMTFVRFGLHIGELPRNAERLSGPAVDAALRLADRAGAGQLWVSSAVRDLLAGSPLSLEPVDDATFRLVPTG